MNPGPPLFECGDASVQPLDVHTMAQSIAVVTEREAFRYVSSSSSPLLSLSVQAIAHRRRILRS